MVIAFVGTSINAVYNAETVLVPLNWLSVNVVPFAVGVPPL